MSTNEIDRAINELGAEMPLQESQAEAEARRRRVLSQMQRVNVELVRESQKVRWLRWGVGGGLVAGAAAAVSLSVLGPFASPTDVTGAEMVSVSSAAYVPLRTEMTRGSVTRVTHGEKQRLGLGDSLVLEEAQMLQTESDSHARVHGGRGLDIDVGPGSQVVVGAVDPKSGATRIQLQRGLVNCSVDPTGEGPKLAVVTPDATVEVKGTIFSVEVMDDEGASRSCVRVQRGWVTVNRRGKLEQVRAGQASGCDTPEDAPAVDVPEAEAPQAENLPSKAEAQEDAAPRPTNLASRSNAKEPSLSSLGLQNSLLARALAAEREGRLDAAESQLSELLGRFPSTPLRADAEAARARIRKRSTEPSP